MYGVGQRTPPRPKYYADFESEYSQKIYFILPKKTNFCPQKPLCTNYVISEISKKSLYFSSLLDIYYHGI